jgi:epoxyqueuosine reductase
MTSLAALITERAHELGFSDVGFVPAQPLRHAEHLRRWLDDGFAGEMAWMHRHEALRTDPRLLEPGTRTVIALAIPYAPTDDEERLPDRIARYAVGLDYHDVLRDRLRSLAAFISAEAGSDVHARPAVDSAPLLERNVAVDAGLGWLGKSAMVIHPKLGTWTFLAELLVDLEIVEPPTPRPDRCGRCTLCIDLCPTGAIVAPYRVDARRCISYLTIELKGPIPRALRPYLQHHLFGCDICQQVCPWNSKATAVPPPIAELLPRPQTLAADARSLLAMDADTFRHTFRGTPLHRTKRRGLARNAAVVLGNRLDPDDLHALYVALTTHDEPLVRGHAAWALGRFDTSRSRTLLEQACARETDSYVLEELRHARTQTEK